MISALPFLSALLLIGLIFAEKLHFLTFAKLRKTKIAYSTTSSFSLIIAILQKGKVFLQIFEKNNLHEIGNRILCIILENM